MGSVERRGGNPRPQVHYLLGDRMYSGDLIFHAGRPVLVISWRSVNWKRVPYVCFPLDADKLKPSSQPDVYLYKGELTIAVEAVRRGPGENGGA
jgi:hypothetical protein